jgi:hypothetical protein
MHPITIELGGKIRPVVHNEGDAALLRDRQQDAGSTTDRRIVNVLQAQLQARDIAAGERLFELLRKGVRVERGRRDQIKPGRRPRFVAASNVQSFPW